VGAVFPPFWEEMGSHLTQCRWADAYLRTKWYLDSTSRSAITDIGGKIGGCAPLGGELGPHLTQCGRGRDLPPYQVSS